MKTKKILTTEMLQQFISEFIKEFDKCESLEEFNKHYNYFENLYPGEIYEYANEKNKSIKYCVILSFSNFLSNTALICPIERNMGDYPCNFWFYRIGLIQEISIDTPFVARLMDVNIINRKLIFNKYPKHPLKPIALLNDKTIKGITSSYKKVLKKSKNTIYHF